jgi:hypothetical protein
MIPKYNIKRLKSKLQGNTRWSDFLPSQLTFQQEVYPLDMAFTVMVKEDYLDEYGEDAAIQLMNGFIVRIENVLKKFGVQSGLSAERTSTGMDSRIDSVELRHKVYENPHLSRKGLIKIMNILNRSEHLEAQVELLDRGIDFFTGDVNGPFVRIDNGDWARQINVFDIPRFLQIKRTERWEPTSWASQDDFGEWRTMQGDRKIVRYELDGGYIEMMIESPFVQPMLRYNSILGFNVPQGRRGTGDARLLLFRLMLEWGTSPLSSQITASIPSLKLFAKAGFTDEKSNGIANFDRLVQEYRNQGETINLRNKWI